MNLQSLILELAPRHEARARVPILSAGNRSEHIAIAGDGSLLIWEGASDATIYRDARVNHAFRAWHDAMHIAGNLGFTLADEIAACELQIRDARLRYPQIPSSVIALIRAEVIGQAQYFEAHGEFPLDQKQFIETYIGAHDAHHG